MTVRDVAGTPIASSQRIQQQAVGSVRWIRALDPPRVGSAGRALDPRVGSAARWIRALGPPFGLPLDP